MVPHLPDKKATIQRLEAAVKGVYASVFYADSKAYMVATSNVIDQEKMAVIIQEVVGSEHQGYFFPSFSGVGRSLNYYPVGQERPEDGVCQVAVGLGKHIVDGGRALRFSPKRPKHVLQTSTTQLALRETQTHFCALDSGGHTSAPDFDLDDGYNIARLPVQDAAAAGQLRYMVSTYDFNNDRIVHTDAMPGRKVVTFANVLEHDAFPLASIVSFMLEQGQRQMGRPVEIEFAANIATGQQPTDGEPHKGELYRLQIKPMIDRSEMLDDNIIQAPP
jgi:hypothetical protein